MVNSPENFDRQRLRSPEAAEARREARPEQLDPVETVESLDRKIADIDSRIGSYAESVEETSAKLAQARAELDMPPMTTEAPSIAQSREAAARLEAQKQVLVAQKEQLGGGRDTKEKPKRLEDDPRYKSLFEEANEHYRMVGADRLKISPAALDGYIRASAAESFKQFYPEDAKAYQEASQAEVEARKAVEAEKAQATREAERVKKEAEARVQKEAKDAAVATEAERRENVELGSFDRSIDDFIGGGVISNDLGEQLKTRRRSGTPDERHAFDEAVGRAGYDFRIKRGSPDALVQALTDLSEGRVNAAQVNETSSEQPTTATRASEAATSDAENTPVDRASAADQQNVRRGLENLWANSGLSDNRLVQLREKIAMGSAEEVRALNTDVMKATRTFARTRDADALAQTLMRLASQGSESGAKVGGTQDEAKRTYADLGVDTPDVALNPEQTTRETESSGTKNILADEKLKREKTGSAIMQFSQSPELFVDQIEDSDADYSPKKGIKVMVDAFKALYPNPGERAARLQSIYAAYRTTREAYKNQHPEKGADFEANYASKQTAVGLPERESRELQNYISRKLDITHPGGSKTRFTTELVMTDFLRFLDNLNA